MARAFICLLTSDRSRLVVYHRKHVGHYLGIELGTGAFDKLFADDFLGKPGAVAARRLHGVISVSDTNDPCDFGYLVSFEMLAVAIFVISFMMVSCAFGYSGKALEVVQDIASYGGMGLYYPSFLGSEFVGFFEYGIGDADLSYAVELTESISRADSITNGSFLGILYTP